MISNLEVLLFSLCLDEADKITRDAFKEELPCDLRIVTYSQRTIIEDLHMLLLASLDCKIALCDVNRATIIADGLGIAIED